MSLLVKDENMGLRDYLRKLENQQKLVKITAPVSKVLETAGILKKLEPNPVLFESIAGSGFKVIGNLVCTKSAFADYLGIKTTEIIPTMISAIDNRRPCKIVSEAACQEVVDYSPDLNALPILTHCPNDGGPYISSGVVISHHPKYGQNADFHRCMQISPTEMSMRVVKGRHFDAFLTDQKQVEVAICIGNSPAVMVAAATSVPIGIDELEIANALDPFKVVKAKTVDVYVPADSEFVLEGIVYGERNYREGPFVDLTETQDIVRQQPVFVIKAITHRKDAIWHALLPGALEHKLLMGMPREPTIFKKVNEVARCLDVNVNPGGCSWLHTIVQIDKVHDDDGLKAIDAAFSGHTSCKHVFVVDGDIDIYDPLQVEWAMATRFQADKDLVIKTRAPGSSLDPSAETPANLTTRAGFDLTKPLVPHGKSFDKVSFPDVDLAQYLHQPDKNPHNAYTKT
jgi:2,5-furandicarboxylate decarboxylase 1